MALCMFKDLIILRTSSSLKSSDTNFGCVKYFDLMEVYCRFSRVYIALQKNYFVLVSFTNLSSTKRGGISGIFFIIINSPKY